MHLILHKTRELMIILFNGQGNTKPDSFRDLRKALCQRTHTIFHLLRCRHRTLFYFLFFFLVFTLSYIWTLLKEPVWHVLKCTAVYTRCHNTMDCFAKLNFCDLIYNRNFACLLSMQAIGI